MKLKEHILDNDSREWLLSADIDGVPYWTDDGKGYEYQSVDVEMWDIFCEITNKDGKCVHILYFKNLDDMEKSGRFSKLTIRALVDISQEKILEDSYSNDPKGCGYDLAQ